MWWLLICVAIVSTWAIVAAVHSASDNIVEELRRTRTPNGDANISKFDLEDLSFKLKKIEELLSISCPQCGDEPRFLRTVAEQRVWLEEHIAEHKSGKLEKRLLDDIVAERHLEEERKRKEFEASHKHLFTPEEEENGAGVTEKNSDEKS